MEYGTKAFPALWFSQKFGQKHPPGAISAAKSGGVVFKIMPVMHDRFVVLFCFFGQWLPMNVPFKGRKGKWRGLVTLSV